MEVKLENEFIKLCEEGDLVKAKNLYENSRKMDYELYNDALMKVCKNGNLEVVQWFE